MRMHGEVYDENGDKHLDKIAEEFPELYSGDGSIFRALYELKRLSKRYSVNPIELSLIAKDIEEELVSHSFYNILDNNAEIRFDLGYMTEDEYREIANCGKKLHYPVDRPTAEMV